MGGRSLTISTVYLLGLSLCCIKTSGRQYSLCPIFALVLTSINIWQDYSLEVLYRVCKGNGHEVLRVKWPSVEEMKRSAGKWYNKRPNWNIFRRLFGVVEGGRIPFMYYNN